MLVFVEVDRERKGSKRIKSQGLSHRGGVALVVGIAQMTSSLTQTSVQ